MINEMVEKCLDSQLWHACAGGMVQIPPLGSKVFYFPQGHAEHAHKSLDFRGYPTIPPQVLCRVSSITYLADFETDEVYAKIRLVPLKGDNECNDDEDVGRFAASLEKNQEKPTNSFAKTLTQSDANNGGGFSVPRYCAETIFPRLDYSAEPPLQTIIAKDVHGVKWKFRHIYRGTPRRHLLTTGWSNFVNQKKLVAGDSIVFLRAENGELFVGIRRAKKESSNGSGWNTQGYFGHSGNCDEGLRGKTNRVQGELVVKAASLAAHSQPFEVVYYPRASTPEFVIKETAVRAAMRIGWCPGMRFKMPFETEDSSRISWFMGTVTSVHVDDPVHWPNSPWRLLQVAWDEPDLLHNVKRVSPWLVELVSNLPPIHLSPFSPPRKKLRLPPHLEFPTISQFPVPSFSLRTNNNNNNNNNPLTIPSSPLSCVSDNNNPAGIQGARHEKIGLFPFGGGCKDFDSSENDENLSCLLTIGQSSPNSKEKKPRELMLFGKAILIEEQQMSHSCSWETFGYSREKTVINLLDNVIPWNENEKYVFGLETTGRHCKVFVDSDDVGRDIELSGLSSYEDLYTKLGSMFGIQRSEMLSNVVYQDTAGLVRHTGDEPFSEFMKKARRLTILSDSSSDNMGKR
ncbi:unnamed protein product [Cuscuta epithymum]|uniref:Auxin response factor n=1 Tax=Cuscuta epithymum TaxID=186058 RepID=A0AAV0DPC4_9ASTE|nr:unnamed protein product [Cuscuta epithymum]